METLEKQKLPLRYIVFVLLLFTLALPACQSHKSAPKQDSYLKEENRLPDVVALIQYLALNSNYGYITLKSVREKLGNNDWWKIADEHREFFRPIPKEDTIVTPSKRNTTVTPSKKDTTVINDTTVILLSRFSRYRYKKDKGKNNDTTQPPPFNITETKSLIDVAVELYKTQLSYQSNSLQAKSINRVFWPAFGAMLFLAIPLIIALIKVFRKSKKDNKLIFGIKKIEKKIDLMIQGNKAKSSTDVK